ncbi:acetylxylan esterase [Streptomyces sp. NPDC059787]|uniref:acetylxylan esterase n=1 Tax=Streptomyces sp. NPDC059787 TaxID=3346947 RepID=UPI00364845EE
MALFDLPLTELRTYQSASAMPDDFDDFWAQTLKEARRHDLNPRFAPVETGLETVRVLDVTFNGFGGHPVKGWLALPAAVTEPLPAVVQFIGYGGGRGLPHTHLLWASTGRAHFVMDTRGQGTRPTSVGDTPDPAGTGPSGAGFMTRGIEAPETYFYRRVFTDAVRAVEAARAHPLTQETRTTVLGTSQGGGIALAVGGLVPDLAAVLPNVPFLCDFPRATTLTNRHPYREIGDYLSAHRGKTGQVHTTLSYFDGVHFASRATAPTLFSTALEDRTCPPSTVFAAYNAWAHPDKEIEVYDFNDHEGGGPYHDAAAMRWLADRC